LIEGTGENVPASSLYLVQDGQPGLLFFVDEGERLLGRHDARISADIGEPLAACRCVRIAVRACRHQANSTGVVDRPYRARLDVVPPNGQRRLV
jgi:hypothetical protein